MSVARTTSRSITPAKHASLWLRGWRLVSLLAIAGAIVTGVVLAWSWLEAGGIFVLFIIVVPCLVVCGLWLCVIGNGSGRRAGSQKRSDDLSPRGR